MTSTPRLHLPVYADLMGWKDVDGEDVVEVETLDEEPVEHCRPGVLQQHVEALAQIRLKVNDWKAL